MKRASILILVFVILIGVTPTQISAAYENGFFANLNLTVLDEPWNTKQDGSGTDYDTLALEFRLKGEGIKSIHGAWIAIDMTKLLLVDYAYDGYSINDEILDGNLSVGKSPARFDNPNYYHLKEDVKEGRATVDSWSYSMINFNLAATSKDGKTLFLCLQPSQSMSVNYDEFTTVVTLRLAILPGSEITSDSVRFINKSERDYLNQSFIIAMNDGTNGYFYGDASQDDTLAPPTVTGNAFSIVANPETDEKHETKEPETVPDETNPLEYEPDVDIVWDNPFTDVPGNAEYIEALEFVYKSGLFKGVSNTEFSPNTTMTRAMFVTVMGRLAGVDPNYFTGESFDDVEAGEWYAPYVMWAAQEGIVQGYGNGKFGVNDNVTVEQAIVIIARYADYVGIDTTSDYRLSSYIDEEEVSSWAYRQIKWAVENRIYSGNGKMLNPTSPAKRYMVAEFLYAFVNEFGN